MARIARVVIPGMPHHLTQRGNRRAIGGAHRRYSRRISFRQGWRGHLWQGRCASFVLDEPYLLACARYVKLNPVRAALTEPETELLMEAPGGLVKARAIFRNGKAERITITNVPSFADKLAVPLEVERLGTLTVDTAYYLKLKTGVKKGDWLRARNRSNPRKNGCREVPVPLFHDAREPISAGRVRYFKTREVTS